MNLFPLIWPPVVAVGIVVLTTLVGVHLFMRFRSWRYIRASRETVKGGSDEPPGTRTTPPRIRELAQMVAEDHKAAVAAQDAYVRAVAGCIVCLLIAFTAAALAVTVWRNNETMYLMLGWIDVFALAWAAYPNFFKGEEANRNWLKLRSRAELLRQYEFLNMLFPPFQAGAITHGYDQQVERIEQKVLRSAVGANLAERVLDFWKLQRSELQGQLSDVKLTFAEAQFYLQQRARRQLRWFGRSKKRLQENDRWRTKVLKWLYGGTLIVAIVKLGLHFCNDLDERIRDVPAFLLLMTTGIAGAMTGIFFSQNQRSLIHRYHAQERRIALWLLEIEAAYPNLMEEAPGNLVKSPAELGERFLAFEELMIEELLDWLHISELDKIELGP